jgi:putative FmdB family regulatory protein
MPTYEYACRGCGGRLEVQQRMTDDPLTTCEQCGGQLRRVLFPVGVVYKGTGFYTTDYARNNGHGKDREADDSKSDGKADSGAKAEKTEQSEKKDSTPAATSSG